MLSRREEPRAGAAGMRRLRHAEDDGALLVLGVRRSAGTLELEQALGTVVAHAGQHEPRARASRTPGPAKRAACCRGQCRPVERGVCMWPSRSSSRSQPSGGQVDAACRGQLSLLGDHDAQGANAVEPADQPGREPAGDVLREQQRDGELAPGANRARVRAQAGRRWRRPCRRRPRALRERQQGGARWRSAGAGAPPAPPPSAAPTRRRAAPSGASRPDRLRAGDQLPARPPPSP